MRENFERSFAATIKHEGGYVDHPHDPGGATNLGITIGTLSGWLGRKATKAEVKGLTVDKVKPIYRRNYWDKVRADDLPSGVDFATYDFAVNSGPARAAIYLQNIVGTAPDGEIGPLTLKAVEAYADRFGARQLINELCSQRLAFLERLSTWPTFGKGWGRRAQEVRELALQMAQNAPTFPLPPQPDIDKYPKPQPSTPAESTARVLPKALGIILLLAVLLVGGWFVVTQLNIIPS